MAARFVCSRCKSVARTQCAAQEIPRVLTGNVWIQPLVWKLLPFHLLFFKPCHLAFALQSKLQILYRSFQLGELSRELSWNQKQQKISSMNLCLLELLHPNETWCNVWCFESVNVWPGLPWIAHESVHIPHFPPLVTTLGTQREGFRALCRSGTGCVGVGFISSFCDVSYFSLKNSFHPAPLPGLFIFLSWSLFDDLSKCLASKKKLLRKPVVLMPGRLF